MIFDTLHKTDRRIGPGRCGTSRSPVKPKFGELALQHHLWGTPRQDAVLYHYGDCYLNLTDDFTRGKVVQSSLGDAPACQSTAPNLPEQTSLLPRSGGYKYQAGAISETFGALDVQAPYENTCDSCPNEIDSGVGLSWELSIDPGGSKTITHKTKVVIPSP
jgi:hypothetical protein